MLKPTEDAHPSNMGTFELYEHLWALMPMHCSALWRRIAQR